MNVRIAVGLRVLESSIGSALRADIPGDSFRAEPGTMLRKRPVAASAARAGMVCVLTATRG